MSNAIHSNRLTLQQKNAVFSWFQKCEKIHEYSFLALVLMSKELGPGFSFVLAKKKVTKSAKNQMNNAMR